MDYAISTRDKKIQSQYKTIIQVYKARTIIPNSSNQTSIGIPS